MKDMVSDNASQWLTILIILLGLAVLGSWYAVHKWSQRGDHEGIPQTTATRNARNAVTAAFVLRVVVSISVGRSSDGGANAAQWAATGVFVVAIACWAWLERERRTQPPTTS